MRFLELGIAWKIQESKLGGLGAAVKRQQAILTKWTLATVPPKPA